MAFRSTIPDFQLANPLYAAAQVTFYTVDPDTGLSTGDLAELFAEPTGTTTASNPQTLDSEGKFLAPVYIEEPVIAEVVGPNVASHTTGPIGARGTYRGEWAQTTNGSTTRYYSGDTLSDPDNPHTIYIATQDFRAGASFAADLAAGNIELKIRGGDTFYFDVDDPGRPSAGETFWRIIPERSTLLATAPTSFGRARDAATAAAVFTIKKRTAAGVETSVGTVTFAASGTEATIDVPDDVIFTENPAAPDEIHLVAPSPRDATLARVMVTIKLFRTPAAS